MKRVFHRIGRYAAVLGICIVAFVVLLTAVFCIPNSAIAPKRAHAYEIFVKEGAYPSNTYYSNGSMLDNHSDHVIIQTAVINDPSHNALEAAMSMNGYARYWHGAQVFVRPALALFTYTQIRYLNMFLLFGLLCITFSLIHKRLSLGYACAFLASMVAVFIITVPASLHFMPVFSVCLSGSIAVLCLYGKRPASDAPLLFFLIGILTSFFDLLTAPLLTLGIPCVLYLLCEIRHNEQRTLWLDVKQSVFICLAWVCGYGLCWLSKWVLADVVLQQGIISDALQNVALRTSGGSFLSRWNAIQWNLNSLLPENTKFRILLAALLLLSAAMAVAFPCRRGVRVRALVLVPFAAAPYVWYLALANHSWIHYYFTFRVQAITVFAVLAFFLTVIDPGKVRRLFSRRKRA